MQLPTTKYFLITLALGFIVQLTPFTVYAQEREIRLELGFSGEMVAGTWNPIKVTLRDQPSATLTIDFDIGSLQSLDSANTIASYTTNLRGGSGVTIFEDDIYIPRWRTLAWSVQTPETVLASGSFERRLSDSRPLHLIVSDNPRGIRNQYIEDSRTVSLLATELSNRPTSYEGIASLVIDDRFVSQRSIVAAASAGTTVVVLNKDTNNYDADFLNFLDLSLAGKTQQRLATGWLVALNNNHSEQLADNLNLPRLDKAAISQGLADRTLAERNAVIQPQLVYLAIILYLICILLLIFFGRVPGFITAISLSLLMAVLASFTLTPREQLIQRSRSIVINSGELVGLAQKLELTQLLSRSAQTFELPLQAHPPNDKQTIWQATPDITKLPLKRWQNSQLIMKPVVVDATLRWDGETLENLSNQDLGDVYIFGGPFAGKQASLKANQSLTNLTTEQDLTLSKLYKDLENLTSQLPPASVLARSGGQLHLALAPDDALRTAVTE